MQSFCIGDTFVEIFTVQFMKSNIFPQIVCAAYKICSTLMNFSENLRQNQDCSTHFLMLIPGKKTSVRKSLSTVPLISVVKMSNATLDLHFSWSAYLVEAKLYIYLRLYLCT